MQLSLTRPTRPANFAPDGADAEPTTRCGESSSPPCRLENLALPCYSFRDNCARKIIAFIDFLLLFAPACAISYYSEVMANDGILYDREQNQQTVSEALEYAIIFRCVANMARHVAAQRQRVGGTNVETHREMGLASGDDTSSSGGGGHARQTDGKASHPSTGDAEWQSARFERLSLVYQRLWDNRTGYFSGRLRDGTRILETRPLHASSSGLWTEGSAIQWMFHVMHDFHGLLSLIGRPLMLQRLELLFTAKGTSQLVDTTGLIGSYAQGNEPSHHVIFWYFLLGMGAKAVSPLASLECFFTKAFVHFFC